MSESRIVGSRTSRAFVLESFGYEGLNERTREIPELQPDEVLVRMRAASLNFRDLKIVKGSYARPPKLPVVLLSDGAGDVVEVGKNVTRFKAGDRVLPIYMQGWYTGPLSARRDTWLGLGGDVDGTAIEVASYREDDVVPIPDSISYEEAACLPCAAVTAWHALISVGHVKPGDTVLAMGSGGVSVFALQLAKIHGARVIAMSSDDAKLKRLLTLGASDGINYRTVPDWETKVRDLTNGRGVDHVIDVAGNGTIRQSLHATRDGGHVHMVGNLTGQFAWNASTERGIQMTPIVVGSREMTEDVLHAIDLHRELPVIDSRFAFPDLKQALRHLESGNHFGKVVITF